MNQELACGLGNIYVDETLFRAGVHPLKLSSKLEPKRIKSICFYAKQVIDEAIDNKGTTIKSFSSNHEAGSFQDKLKVYGRDGLKC